MKNIYFLFLLLFCQMFFAQEFQNNFQRAEELPVKKAEISNITKIEDAVYMTASGDTKHFAIREYNYKNGMLQSVKTYDGKKVLSSDERFFYNENNELIKITEFISSDFTERKYSETEVVHKKNKKGQLIEITFYDTNDKNVSKVKKFSSYLNDNKDYILEETSITDIGDDINDKDLTYRMKFTYKNGYKVLYENLRTYNEISYEYDSDGILIKKEGREFIDEKDSRGNVIKRVLNSKMMILSNFYKITYADGTTSGSMAFDNSFVEKIKK